MLEFSELLVIARMLVEMKKLKGIVRLNSTSEEME
jgi:hypothetical protein